MSRKVFLAAVFAIANIGPVAASDRLVDGEFPVVELASIARIEAKLNLRDLKLMSESRQHALETYGDGQALSWNNAESGHSGLVAARPGFTSIGDTGCREIRERVLIETTYYEASGRFCRISYDYWVNRTPQSRKLADRAK
jgi:surface antigen